jgi:hypothetical protein
MPSRNVKDKVYFSKVPTCKSGRREHSTKLEPRTESLYRIGIVAECFSELCTCSTEGPKCLIIEQSGKFIVLCQGRSYSQLFDLLVYSRIYAISETKYIQFSLSFLHSKILENLTRRCLLSKFCAKNTTLTRFHVFTLYSIS